jgi:hypothetical protein
MYNRYVDGLNTSLPENSDDYIDMGKRLAQKGYKYPPSYAGWYAASYASIR